MTDNNLHDLELSIPKGALPTVKSYFGAEVQLIHDDLIQIEDLVAVGASVGMVAIELCLDEKSLRHAVKNCLHIQAAIKRGRAKDEHEYMTALRAKSLEMSSPILSIWHSKQAYGYQDKATINTNASTVITVNTGVPQPTTPHTMPPIEHDANE